MAAPTQLTVVADARDGSSQFRDLELPRELSEIAAGVPPVLITAPLQALGVSLVEVPEGGEADPEPHTAARAQLVVLLSGALEIDTGAEVRRFGAGDIVLVADTSGRGHITRILERPTTGLFVAVDRDAVARLLARR